MGLIKLFTTPNCLGCKNSRNFLTTNGFEFIERDISKEGITRDELIDILYLSENGFDDIVSVRSNSFKTLKSKKIDDLSFNDALDLIQANPLILHRPIIVQYNEKKVPTRILIGYNKDDITIFLRDLKTTTTTTITN
ncbi:MAG: Spx/MgsR family RNA polymerase-binding regulatory protein [Mycoplasmataceae bacterium]|jgi:regulatory protein spx|nr:Spx/MgsR family RNA polymerase-binding regulatory protein [Mycoplasmataceae bacterium]